MKVAVLLLVAFAVAGASALQPAKAHYDGHTVVRLSLGGDQSSKAVYDLYANNTLIPGLDWWHDPQRGLFADVRVSPSTLPQLKAYLAANNIAHYHMIEDIQALIDAEERQLAANRIFDATRMPASSFPYDQYNSLEDIEAWLLTLPKQYPGLANTIVVSSSFEGRNVYVVKVTGNSTSVNSKLYRCGWVV